jgi:hypothetical protein
MRNVTMRALIGHDVLADVHAIRVPITFIVGGWDVPIVWNARGNRNGTGFGKRNAPTRSAFGLWRSAR